MKGRNILIVLMVVILSVCVLFNGSYAQSQNNPTKEIGKWKNIDPNTRGVTKADISFSIGMIGCTPYSLFCHNYLIFYAQLWGSCEPTDCDWGKVEAEYDTNGWLRTVSENWCNKKYVWAKVYTYNSVDFLRIYIWTDFIDPNRHDYAQNEWFIRD